MRGGRHEDDGHSEQLNMQKTKEFRTEDHSTKAFANFNYFARFVFKSCTYYKSKSLQFNNKA